MNFTWSFSSLKDYVNCPKKYQEDKVLKRWEEWLEYEAGIMENIAVRGDRMH